MNFVEGTGRGVFLGIHLGCLWFGRTQLCSSDIWGTKCVTGGCVNL